LTTTQLSIICYKPFLKPVEAMLYCHLGHSQLTKRLTEYGIHKTATGYYRREELDRMMEGRQPSDPV
jgi:hypothetical protein